MDVSMQNSDAFESIYIILYIPEFANGHRQLAQDRMVKVYTF